MSLKLGTEIYTGTEAPVDIDVKRYMYSYHIAKAPRWLPAVQATQ
jgi:hypothetical protein